MPVQTPPGTTYSRSSEGNNAPSRVSLTNNRQPSQGGKDMFTHLRHTAVLTALIVAAFAFSPLARADDPPVSLQEAYAQIKSAEGKIPVPTPQQSIAVGTFNATTGEFDGLKTEVEIINGKPVRLVPHVSINAVNARLVFQLLGNATKSVRLSVSGVGLTIAPAGRTSVAIDVGRLRDVSWSLVSGIKTYRDQLKIDRPRIIGAGAFTIPALPIAVAYDPPQNPAGTNSVVYKRSTSLGISMGFTVGKSTSTTTADTAQFPVPSVFHQQLVNAAAVETLAGNGVTAAALQQIDRFIGKAQRNVTTKEDGTSTSRRAYTFTEEHSCGLADGVRHLGPGHSDLVVYLRNARVVWFDNGFTTSLQLLGYDAFDCVTIDQLRSGTANLDPAAANALIALDPFATSPLGPKVPLAADPRYASLPGIGLLPDVVVTATYTQQLLIDNTRSESSARTVTDDLGAGLLSLVGLAPSQSQQVVATLSVGTTLETTDTTTVSTTLTARTLTDGIRTELAVFYDRIFGTVAFQDPRP